MKPLKLILVLAFTITVREGVAQTDSSAAWELVYPTKTFRVLGQRWQLNGYNLIAGVGRLPFNRGNKAFNHFFKLAPVSNLVTIKNMDEAMSVSKSIKPGRSSCSELGFTFSYDLIQNSQTFFNKEVRVGLFYSKWQEGSAAEHFIMDSAFGNQYSKVWYEYFARETAISLKIDVLFNSKPFLKNFAAYSGLGFTLGLPLEQDISLDQIRFKTGVGGSRLTYLPDISSFSMNYGVNGTIGAKFSASCWMNIFAEYSTGWQGTTYFKVTSLDYSWMFRLGLRSKLNVWSKVDKKNDDHIIPPDY